MVAFPVLLASPSWLVRNSRACAFRRSPRLAQTRLRWNPPQLLLPATLQRTLSLLQMPGLQTAWQARHRTRTTQRHDRMLQAPLQCCPRQTTQIPWLWTILCRKTAQQQTVL